MRDSWKYVDTQNSKKRAIGSTIAGMHKEQYFTLDTIQEKAQDFLDSVESSRRRHADIVFQPRKAALLVLDMQDYFLQESSHAFVPSASAIVPEISNFFSHNFHF